MKGFDINPGTIDRIRQKVAGEFSNFERLKNREDSSEFDDFLTKSIVTTQTCFSKTFTPVKQNSRPQKNKCVSNDRSRHDDSNGPRIVKIGAILAIFEHFKVWTSAQDLRARSRKTFRARPRLVNLFYKLLYV